MTSSSLSGMTKKWQVPVGVKLSCHPGLGRMPGWGPSGLGVCPSALIFMVFILISCISVCWYRTTAKGEMGEGEWEVMSLMKAASVGES